MIKERSDRYVWYNDYICMTSDKNFIWWHFLKDFIFYHRVRYMVYFRISQKTKSRWIHLFCEYKLYRLCQKFGIEIKTSTQIGPGFVMVHPYNITISPEAVLGENVTILKGATIGVSYGKRPGAPQIGNCVYIGINSTILGGIKIGNEVLIAPNTFVNQDVPSNSIVIGNPCRIISKENAADKYLYIKLGSEDGVQQ